MQVRSRTARATHIVKLYPSPESYRTDNGARTHVPSLIPTRPRSAVLEGRTDSWQKINYQGILILKEYASGNKYGVNIRVALRDVCDRSPGLCDYNEFVSSA